MSPKNPKRVLLKLSGEQLAGKEKNGIDLEMLDWLSSEIKKVVDSGIQLAIVVGGGNYIRGADFAEKGIEPATSHYMGMIATVINGMALTDTLEKNGLESRMQTSFEIRAVAEPFIRRRAIRHLEKGRIVVCAAGTGRPFVTTDTAAVSFALELNCSTVLKATNVDGVYDKDPRNNPDAKLYETLSLQEALETPAIKVMDKSAIGLAMEQKMPITVFNLNVDDNIFKAATGQNVGTRVT